MKAQKATWNGNYQLGTVNPQRHK